jgi:hypothetical protein
MIIIDLNTAIAVFFSVCFVLVFGMWVVYNFSGEKSRGFTEARIIQCPYCTHCFSDHDDALMRCPKCKSIIDPLETREDEEGA